MKKLDQVEQCSKVIVITPNQSLQVKGGIVITEDVGVI